MVHKEVWEELRDSFEEKGVRLVAVSKTKPAEDVRELYELGQRDFGENYVQELVEKQGELPGDINWHFIGHLQSNKVKQIAPFVHLIHTVDSIKLLNEINKQAGKCGRIIDVLLQLYIADEETKFGLDEEEIRALLQEYAARKSELASVRICGLMGMATNSDDVEQVRGEFEHLHTVFSELSKTVFAGEKYFSMCSMGMSADYETAIVAGSNMVRIGSILFGARKMN